MCLESDRLKSVTCKAFHFLLVVLLSVVLTECCKKDLGRDQTIAFIFPNNLMMSLRATESEIATVCFNVIYYC